MKRDVLDRDGRPLRLVWSYRRSELIADGVVHALGAMLAVIGAIALVILAVQFAPGREVAAVAIYLASLLAMLWVSAAYNMWPVSRTKWMLRRFDHAAIYVLIAGTYTPFLTQLHDAGLAVALLVGIWSTALLGVGAKLLLPGRFDRLSIVLYLALSWSGVMAYGPVAAALPASTLWLLGIGGLLYSGGVVFHLWQGLRFQNAIWHAFVLLACGLHYGAVLDGVVLSS